MMKNMSDKRRYNTRKHTSTLHMGSKEEETNLLSTVPIKEAISEDEENEEEKEQPNKIKRVSSELYDRAGM